MSLAAVLVKYIKGQVSVMIKHQLNLRYFYIKHFSLSMIGKIINTRVASSLLCRFEKQIMISSLPVLTVSIDVIRVVIRHDIPDSLILNLLL